MSAEPRRAARSGVLAVPAHWLALTLLSAAALGAAAAGGWTWFVPVFIAEGPLVQGGGDQPVRIVWYTSRPEACTLAPRPGGGAAPTGSPHHTPEGWRHCVQLDDAARRAAGYRIACGGRVLADHPLRVPDGTGPLSFIVFGDSGKGTDAQYALARRMVALRPDFLLHTGDLVYGEGERVDYAERFFAPYAPLLREVPFWPCLGNHDINDGHGSGPYREVFELPENGPPGEPPEHHYWFQIGPVRVAVIDSNVSREALAARVAPWLREVMQRPGARWRFVSLHHPPWSIGPHGSDERLRETLVPVFEQTRVDVVFAGHDHLYARSRPIRAGRVVPPGQGVVYVVSGAGGARLYEARRVDPPPEWLAAWDDRHHSFTHVRIDAAGLHLRQYAADGSVLDEWHLPRAAAPDRG